MPELKNLFIKGKMNKDLDERLVPQGEYRDALNVSVSYSEGSDVGALQNILGNTERNGGLSFPAGATCIGAVRDTENDKIYWFGTSATADYIAELDPSDNSVDIILCDTGSILNFSTSNLITGVAVLDGVLYFTDDLNEPRQVDIEYWRGVTDTDFTTSSTNLSDDRISLYKKGPLNAPTFHTFSSSARSGVGTNASDVVVVTTAIPDLDSVDINSTGNNITFNEDTAYAVNDIISLKRNKTITGGKISISAKILLTTKTDAKNFQFTLLAKSENIEPVADLEFEAMLEEDEPLFKLKFPRFSYRYKYTNGQYSTLAPFSLPAFIPGDFEYDAKQAYNLGMENTLRVLKLEGWVTSPSSDNYEADIEEIDILYKDSVSPNVYIVESIKKESNAFVSPLEIKDEQIFKAIQSNQLLRPFDSIPRKAKALEVTGNRLIFGNYLQNFDYTDTPEFDIKAISRENSNEITSKLSLKSSRTYQVGIVFQDEYGRQTPVFTDKSGVKKIDKNSSDLNLQLQISTSTTPPSEATHYKYYIKETSNEYYNICVSNIYDDKDGFLYLSFPSAEVNKISEDDYIVFKKQSGDVAYKNKNNRFKVIDKLNNPPDFLAKKYKATYIADRLIFGDGYGEDITLQVKEAGKTPVEGHNTIILQDAGESTDTDASTQVSAAFMSEMTPGTIVRFRKAGTDIITNNYTIKTNTPQIGQFSGDDQRETEIIFEEEFGVDVNFLYDAYVGLSNIINSPIIMEKLEQIDDSGNPEYEGKFFIKLNNDSQLLTALEEAYDESTLNTIATKNITFDQADQDKREYWVPAINRTGGVLTYNSFSTPDGYHIAIATAELYNDGGSFYKTDPFLKEIQEVGNYIRFSSGPSWSTYYSYGAIASGITNSRNLTLTSATSVPSSLGGIQVGDFVGVVVNDSGFDKSKQTIVTAVDGLNITLNTPQTIANGTGLQFYRPSKEIPNYRIEEIRIDPAPHADGAIAIVYLKLDKDIEDALPTPAQYYQFSIDVRKFDLNKAPAPGSPPIFEIEPKEGVLDIYYETEKTYDIADLANYKELSWANCISFGNGVESDRIRDDYNTPTIGKGVRVSTVFEDNYKEERVKSGLIFSGLYNGKNGINRLNQFIIAENITEEANPIYGSIQKLNTRDTDLTLLCDDAILKVPARKDLLFQADGNPQVTSTDRFLGTIIPYAGNYGCQHPESFADHIYRAYFVDRTRGKVLRLGGDGITEISNYGMKDYFKDKLVAETGYMFGSYDENKDQYNISLPVEQTVVSFSESVNGWPTRKSFYEKESGISLNNMYYTFKDGKIFSHDNETRNTFYGTKIDSEVTFYLNGNPGNAKNFRTLNYQGDSGWVSSSIATNKQTGNISSFIEKEGIYYNYISGETQTAKADLDLKALNVQGLGTPTSISVNDAAFAELPSLLQPGDKVFNNSNDDVRTVQSISGNTITLDAAPTNAFSYFVKDNKFNTSGVLGYYAEITMTNTSTDKKELYSVGSEVSLSS